MKRFLSIALTILPLLAWGASPIPPATTTPYTRVLLQKRTAADARAWLGIGDNANLTNANLFGTTDFGNASLQHANGTAFYIDGTINYSYLLDLGQLVMRGGGSPLPSTIVLNATNGGVVASNYFGSGAFLTNVIGTKISPGALTAEIQSAFDAGGVIWFMPGVYTISNTINITKSVTVYGNGATNRWALGKTNFMWDTGTNLLFTGQLNIYNVYFDGQEARNYAASQWYSAPGSIDPFYNTNYANRGLLRVSSSGGGTISGCTFKGSGGSAVHLINTNGIAAHSFDRMKFVNNSCQSNFIGMFAVSAQWDVPGYYNAPSGLWAQFASEYTIISGNYFGECQFGLIASAGNCNVIGNQMTGNYTGLYVGPGNNSAHGIYSCNTINHNVNGIYFESNNGGIIQDNTILANTTPAVFDGITQLIFTHNFLSAGILAATNGCIGIIENNYYQGGWGTDIQTNFLNSRIVVSGNHNETNDDGSVLSQLTSTNWNGEAVFRKSVTANGLFNLGGQTNIGAVAVSNSVTARLFASEVLSLTNDYTWDGTQSVLYLDPTTKDAPLDLYLTNAIHDGTILMVHNAQGYDLTIHAMGGETVRNAATAGVGENSGVILVKLATKWMLIAEHLD